MRKLSLVITLFALAALPALSQTAGPDLKATVLKHLKISEAFTAKVAEAMPEADYNFKLTPAQMSFSEQIVHLSNALGFILSPITGEKTSEEKKPTQKAGVVALVHASYQKAIAAVGKMTPQQLAKTYPFEGGTATGLDLLFGALDHSTHHRASAEMYLRAKGVTPPEYQF